MKKITLLVSCLLNVLIAQGQYNETIRSGRPGRAIGPFAVGKQVIQVQTGYEFESLNDLQEVHGQATTIRVGLTELFEVNTAFNWTLDKFKERDTQPATTTQGIDSWSIGFRYDFFQGENLIPTIGIQTTLKMNHLVTEAYRANFVAPRILLITNQRLSKKIGFTTNWELNWSGIDGTPKEAYVVTLNYGINKKLGVFIENYGSFSQAYFDAGLSYLFTKHIQWDIFGGRSIFNPSTNEYFISTGISFRLVPAS
ncbi:MAG: transporter [Thermonemataceae bacterium]